MAGRRHRARPSDPMDIARRRAAERVCAQDPARWGVDASQMTLGANHAVEIGTDAAGRVSRARRVDVFDAFLRRGKLSAAGHDAVRRLQDDIAILHRAVGGSGEYAPRVDRSRNPLAFTDRRRAAGRRIEAALSGAGPASARLLAALCEADVVLGHAGCWRRIVARETGESLADGQGAILRAACENLAGAYCLIDRGRRERARGFAAEHAERPGTPA
ncbi:MAG TPA: hypothetical protein VII73_10890 [Caulobacteraceae bacterium]